MAQERCSEEWPGTDHRARPFESAPNLLDEQSDTTFRKAFGAFARRSTFLDSAVARIRLTGLDLVPEELQNVKRLRVVLAEVNAVTLRSEAEAVLSDRSRAKNLQRLVSWMEDGIIHVRAAPLTGWAPDFTIFSWNESPQALMIGLHWFEQPYPHQGPVLTSIHGPRAAHLARERFEGIWTGAHDVGAAILDVLRAADRRISPASGIADALAQGSDK